MSTRPIRWKKLLALLLLPVWFVACSDPGVSRSYIAVIDAGSSGSRIYLYERTVDGADVQVKPLFDEAGGLPMSSFEASPADAGPLGLQPLIDKLSPSLAKYDLRPQQIQVHLLATAGMRLVEDKSKANADAIYASVRNTLVASGMSVGRVETLTGTYEGVYSWVDVNYLKGNFRETGQSPEGIIEVGGASAQVAYVSPSATGPNSVSVNVNGKGYRLFSISWLGLGQNEARGAMIDSAAVGGGTENNACYPNNQSNAGKVTKFNADINNKAINQGQYNFATCDALYSTVIGSKNVGNAAGNADFAAARFVGVSSVYFALRDWKGLDKPTDLAANLTATCTGPDAWAGVFNWLNAGTEATPFQQNACANGTYVNSLLFGNAGLKVDPAKVAAVNKINGQSLSWTRGFALIGQ